ncbi:MAG TPA: glycerol-3-phosphate dehydrogenase/oxidase [Steroidobacteraceae bacterium]|nr:glycerol-3-phosphate dehydrogenase/oxidase [Steroidobacteraceae bacterium]
METTPVITRDVRRLSSELFDVLVVGGGASGAAAAREAALRGFNTALIEREDFSAGASAHCFKVVHGGIRYVQHADVRRLRASCFERAVLLRIAPHLVSPLPFVIPTYGKGKSSRWFLGTGMLLYDALSADVNRHVVDPARRVRGTRFLSRSETLELFPDIAADSLTGAAVFEDGQMYNPPRLVLAFVGAASELGAAIGNYVEAERLLTEGTRVTGVQAADRLTGDRFDIRARLVINAAGPWAEGLLQSGYGQPGTYSRDACFMVDRKFATPMALAVQGRAKDSDALLARNSRHLFLVPWRNSTLVGVWHSIVPRDPDSVGLARSELRQFIDEFNTCYPNLQLREDEVRRTDFGLVPFGDASSQQGGLSFGKQSRLIDHREHGQTGLISLISVRYTVARRDAVEALDVAARQLDARRSERDSTVAPLTGGDIADFTSAVRAFQARRPSWLTAKSSEGMLRNYGTHATRILELAQREPGLGRLFTGSHVSFAEAIHAVRAETAHRMGDIVFRRTELGTDGHPGTAALDELQALLGAELRWSEQRSAEERARVERELQRYLAAPSARAAPLQQARRA